VAAALAQLARLLGRLAARQVLSTDATSVEPNETPETSGSRTAP
jgi:hypothetical protein